MIKVVGARRLVIWGVLVAINAFLGASTYAYLYPHNEKLERDFRKTRGDIATRQNETERLRTEYKLILEQKTQYENLKDTGFLGPQDRVVARERMEAIQSYSHVLLADYNIKPVRIVENTEAARSDQVILESDISAQVDAIDDTDVFSFLYWLRNGFPGHITIESLELSREKDVNDVTLRQIGTGEPLVMVKGKMDFVWRTMVPRDNTGVGGMEKY